MKNPQKLWPCQKVFQLSGSGVILTQSKQLIMQWSQTAIRESKVINQN